MSWIAEIKERLVAQRRMAVLVLAGLLAFWFMFLDSHSLWTRVHLHREQARLEFYNAELKAEIAVIEDKLSRPLTDEEVERIAREEYGMQRDDETVYPVDKP